MGFFLCRSPLAVIVFFLLQALSDARVSLLSRSHQTLHVDAPSETCTSLTNRQTHFTVSIGVGTPTQTFDVVADTGSDSVIVTSCICMRSGSCSDENKCFQGMNHSSTFSFAGLNTYDTKVTEPQKLKVPEVVLTFGSGQIEAIIATDIVTVGKISSKMNNGVLLMVDQALRMNGPFEGILGLGIPRRRKNLDAAAQKDTPSAARSHDMKVGGVYESRGFLQSAGVPRFSLCFNSGEDGVLRLGQPRASLVLGSIGQVHWGLDFRGISLTPSGGVPVQSSNTFTSPSSRLSFCDREGMKEGQVTACGAIPDSGTTVIMGPAEHLVHLFESICTAWPKCQKLAEANTEPKIKVFENLLMKCGEWMTKEGLDELPTLNFYVAGADETEQVLNIDPSGYIMEILEDELHYVKKHLMGIFEYTAAEPTGKQITVCSPAFGKQDFKTEKNGPVWILGTPLFYQYQVGYDLETQPPAVSFLQEPCGACSNGEAKVNKTAFLTDQRHSNKASAKWPRRMSGPFRTPNIDPKQPL